MVHVGELAGVVVGKLVGIVEGMELVAGPAGGVAVVAHPELEAHAVAHGDEAMEDDCVADEPGRDGRGQDEGAGEEGGEETLAGSEELEGGEGEEEGGDDEAGGLGETGKTGEKAEACPGAEAGRVFEILREIEEAVEAEKEQVRGPGPGGGEVDAVGKEDPDPGGGEATRGPKLRRARKKRGMQARELMRQSKAWMAKMEWAVWTPKIQKKAATMSG